jgi:NADPH-dependent ferric siderophore reductase
MSNERYPKRTAKVIDKKFISSDLIRIFFKLENLLDLPENLTGRHIKLLPFNDDYMKSYTISGFDKDIVSLDIHLHLKGRGSVWANECNLDDQVTIWGPKKDHSDPININSNKVLLVCDLCGLSTMISLISKMKQNVLGDLIIESNNSFELDVPRNIKVSFVNSIDLEILTHNVKKYEDIFVILGIEDIKYLNSNIEVKKNIRLKAYWK